MAIFTVSPQQFMKHPGYEFNRSWKAVATASKIYLIFKGFVTIQR